MTIQWSTARKCRRPVSQKDLRGKVLTIALAFLAAAWLSFLWTAMTGLTFATRRAPGRIATDEDRVRSRHLVVLVTVIAGPVALWAATKRR